MEPTAAHDTMLTETIARHFPAATIDDSGEIALGVGELRIACRVHAIRALGDTRVAALYFSLRGGRLGEAAVFASVSGYADSPEAAIIGGACNWACAFGPVLRAGLADDVDPEVSAFEVAVEGQPVRVFVDGLDRAASFDDADASPRLLAARTRFAPRTWLVREVLAAGLLPILAADRPTLVSVFVMDQAGNRVVEVKLDGEDWPGMASAFAAVAREPAGAVTMLRELAVVVPIGAPVPLAREPIARTLRGVADRRAWPGWAHHGGALAEPIAAAAAELATLGDLPADYRAFVTAVGGSGAGPGYGLLSPLGDGQRALARGAFAWTDESEPTGMPSGVLALAHAGCGVMWLLVVAGPRAGEVWVDARSSDRKVRRVAASFSAWYRDWLIATTRSASPWIQWDSDCCASAHTIAEVLRRLGETGLRGAAAAAEIPRALKPGAITLASADRAYVAAATRLNPCHGCVTLAASFGLDSSVFRPGEELRLDAPQLGGGPAKRGWWAQLAGKLRPT